MPSHPWTTRSLNHGDDPVTTQRSTASDPSSLSLYNIATHLPSSRRNSLSTTILGRLRLTMTSPPRSSRHRLRSASQREHGESRVSLRPLPIDHQHRTLLLRTNSTFRESPCRPLAGRNRLITPRGQKPRLSDSNLPSLRLTKQDLSAGSDSPHSSTFTAHLFNLLAQSLRQHTMVSSGVWIYMHL